MKVKDRKTGQTFTAYVQSVDMNEIGDSSRYVLRYVIGHEASRNGEKYLDYFRHAIYDNDEFNEMYEVVK